MSLREALAARLHGIFWHGTPCWQDCEPHEANRWRDVADECIRQMEWARRRCVGAQLPGGPPDRELRAAPPDWTP